LKLGSRSGQKKNKKKTKPPKVGNGTPKRGQVCKMLTFNCPDQGTTSQGE